MEFLLILILLIIALYSWYMGYRTAKKQYDNLNNKFNLDYAEGLSFLLSNQQEKAVDLFLQIIQNSSDSDYNDKFNAKLTLGNLFRSRGDFQQAIKIHRQLRIDNNSSYDQKLLASSQMALDFINIGIYDRAEKIYLNLLDEPNFKNEALSMLCTIYERTKDWSKAINVAEKSLKIDPDNYRLRLRLANYHCELLELEKEDKKIIKRYQDILKICPYSIRSLIGCANKLLDMNESQKAIQTYQEILNYNEIYIGEVINSLKKAYQQLNQLDKYGNLILNIFQRINNKKLELALIEYFSTKNKNEFEKSLYDILYKKPSIYIFNEYLAIQINKVENNDELKISLQALHDIISHKLLRTYDYYCKKCGYKTRNLQWYCKACQEWETFVPYYEYE